MVDLNINEDLHCCGVREISGLSDAISGEEILLDWMNAYGDEVNDEYSTVYRNPLNPSEGGFAHVMFSAAGGEKVGEYGKLFARFLVANGLGSVISTKVARNPNTGNRLKVWIWTINRPALKAWWSKHKVRSEPRDA